MLNKVKLTAVIVILGAIYALIGFLTANNSDSSLFSLLFGLGVLVLIVLGSFFSPEDALSFTINTLAALVIIILGLTCAYLEIEWRYTIAILGSAALLYLISFILRSFRN